MGRRSVIVVAAVAALALLAAGCSVPPVTTDPPAGATGPSPGCGSTTRASVTERAETVSVGGATRRYTLTVPPEHVAGTDDPIPLVLDFHGLLEGFVGTHPLATQFSALARAEGFAVAYPIGSNNGIYWDVSLQETNPDLRFIDALLADLGDKLCIDRSRTYVTGLSYGAAMTSMLMCMRPNTFAAAAPVAGILNFCASTPRKVPFVSFHGTSDPILPYRFFAGTPAAIASKYGCEGPPTTVILDPDPDPGTGGPVTRATWDCRSAGSAAESYVLEGGGHSWPGSEFFTLVGPVVGTTATSLDATEVIWNFFTQHHL